MYVKVTANLIVKIQTQGDRIILGDVQDSITYVVYNPLDNIFTAFADDTFPRWINCFQMIDFDTCVLGDKFGNLAVIRLPTDVSRDIVNDNTGSKLTMERSFLQGAAHRVILRRHFLYFY
jgi:splicing factor 3B subunit 3